MKILDFLVDCLIKAGYKEVDAITLVLQATQPETTMNESHPRKESL